MIWQGIARHEMRTFIPSCQQEQTEKSLCIHHYTSLIPRPLPAFQRCSRKNIEKLGVAWGRGYLCRNFYNQRYDHDNLITISLHLDTLLPLAAVRSWAPAFSFPGVCLSEPPSPRGSWKQDLSLWEWPHLLARGEGGEEQGQERERERDLHVATVSVNFGRIILGIPVVYVPSLSSEWTSFSVHLLHVLNIVRCKREIYNVMYVIIQHILWRCLLVIYIHLHH